MSINLQTTVRLFLPLISQIKGSRMIYSVYVLVFGPSRQKRCCF